MPWIADDAERHMCDAFSGGKRAPIRARKRIRNPKREGWARAWGPETAEVGGPGCRLGAS